MNNEHASLLIFHSNDGNNSFYKNRFINNSKSITTQFDIIRCWMDDKLMTRNNIRLDLDKNNNISFQTHFFACLFNCSYHVVVWLSLTGFFYCECRDKCHISDIECYCFYLLTTWQVDRCCTSREVLINIGSGLFFLLNEFLTEFSSFKISYVSYNDLNWFELFFHQSNQLKIE